MVMGMCEMSELRWIESIDMRVCGDGCVQGRMGLLSKCRGVVHWIEWVCLFVFCKLGETWRKSDTHTLHQQRNWALYSCVRLITAGRRDATQGGVVREKNQVGIVFRR